MLAALIEIIKSSEVAEQNVKDRAGAIGRAQFERDNEDDNISWKLNIDELRWLLMMIFYMMWIIRFSFSLIHTYFLV